MSNLKKLINKLSKSSPEAVHTFTSTKSEIFRYLYIKTKVEEDFITTLENTKMKKSIIFLCGSSGDGKSAIIANNIDKYKEYYSFHIDATHSFRPDQSAIEALNDVFNNFKSSNKSLIVGINMGILLNYAREGNDANSEIKDAINQYDLKQENSNNIKFINFEDYPKFEIDEDSISSSFIKKIFNRITENTDNNPFYKAYIHDLNNNVFDIEHKNFYLFSNEYVKKSIIELLVTIHLKYDQFLTSRSILDFIHVLLKGPLLLIDQLFENNSNAILENINKEDPILHRTQQLDVFQLERSTKKEDEQLNNFIYKFNENLNDPILSLDSTKTLVRFFYLLKDTDCSTNYHKKFSNDFNEPSTLNFIKLVIANQEYSNDTKRIIQSFYTQIKNAIFAYANKKNPLLSDENLFHLNTLNKYTIYTYLEIDPNIKKIKNVQKNMINTFSCHLKINDKEIDSIEVNLNMYKMILAINKGYRPNKHDRNTIILFEDLIENIANKIKDSKKLVYIKNNKRLIFKNNIDEIEVMDVN